MNDDELDAETTRIKALVCDLFTLNNVPGNVGANVCINMYMLILMSTELSTEQFNESLDQAKIFYAEHYKTNRNLLERLEKEREGDKQVPNQ